MRVPTWTRKNDHALTKSLMAVLALAAFDAPEAAAEPPGGMPAAASASNGGRPVVFPGDRWKSGKPRKHGLSEAGLAQMNAVAEELGSTCMLVIHDGRVVSEWYAPGYGPDTQHLNLFSVTKSVTSTLVGIAQAEGLLDIEDSAADYIGAWSGTASEAVTIRNLISNDSGRFWSMESDYGALLFGADQTGYAIGLEQVVPPGTHWEYNNAAIQTLSRVLEVATGEDVEAYARRKLFDPIGMQATLTRDGAGNPLTYQGLSTSCHDIARFGWLMLNQGNWDGQQIVPGAWVGDATTPRTELNDAYGYMWWLNREGHVVLPSFPFRSEYEGRLVPAASEGVFSALGAFGQLVIVDPADGYVVVRLQDVLDLNEALATDPDPLGVSKLDLLLTAFEQAKL
jgi:CubicO group peptidase (beta-lactamase class C family)